jgi:hypothetical protein
VGNNEDGEQKKDKKKKKQLSRKQQITQLSFEAVETDDEAAAGDVDKENSAPSEG